MNSIVKFRLCTLTDEELLEAVDKKTDQMYKDGKIPSRHIPARPNEDYDLLVGELIKRFYETTEEYKIKKYNEEMAESIAAAGGCPQCGDLTGFECICEEDED